MDSAELTPWIIRYGYRQGLFPMTMEEGDIGWFQPRRRCLFPIEGIRVSRSLAKTLRQNRFEILFDTAFEEVMRGCLRPGDNWISETFIRTYTTIHHEGWGHSAEAWRDGELVGGVYGIAIGRIFCAESMFHRVTDASKVALHAMVEQCRRSGYRVFDAQIMNPHLASLGAYEISHHAYMNLISEFAEDPDPWQKP